MSDKIVIVSLCVVWAMCVWGNVCSIRNWVGLSMPERVLTGIAFVLIAGVIGILIGMRWK